MKKTSRDPDWPSLASPWFTRRDAAAYALVSVATLSRSIRTGRLRAYRIAGGRAVRLHRDDVDAWLRTHLTGVERVLRRGR